VAAFPEIRIFHFQFCDQLEIKKQIPRKRKKSNNKLRLNIHSDCNFTMR
jgi:hypothetical protein